MKKVLILISIFLIFPSILIGQDLGEMIEATEGTEIQEESLPPSAPQVDSQENRPQEENASWFGNAIRTLLEIGILGPIGVIAGEALEAANRDSTRIEREQERMVKVTEMTEEKQIQRLKMEIQRRFGIAILEAPPPSDDENITNARSIWETSSWTLEQLETIEDQLSKLPSSFVQYTKKICKFKALSVRVYETDENGQPVINPILGRPRVIDTRATESLGFTFRNQADTVNIFDPTFQGDYSRREAGLGKLRTVLVHEMTHCFHFQKPDVLSAWARKFWTAVGTSIRPFANEAGDEFDLTTFTPIGYWELGCPVSIYAGSHSRYSPGIPVGQEDIAEATTLAAIWPNIMAEKFSERNSFVRSQILTSEGGVTGDGESTNPRQFGYCESMKWNLREGDTPGTVVTSGVTKTDSYTEEFDKTDFNFGNGLHYLRDYANISSP